MKITDVTTHLVTAKWDNDPSFGVYLFSSAMIRVSTDAGLEGVGETTMGYFCPESVPPMVEFFKPALVGKDPMQLTRLAKEMYDQSQFWARSAAARSVISGIEIALWDLLGKALKVPVYQLLGGAIRDQMPIYASGGPSLWPIEANVRKIAGYQKLGYRAAKLSTHFYEDIGRSATASGTCERLESVPVPHALVLDQMVESFEGLRKEFGGDFDFAIDGHQGATPDPIPVTEAVEIAEALAPFRLVFYEEPLAYTDLDNYAELRRRSRIPIAGGESMAGLDQFHGLMANGGVNLIQPDIGFCGGVAETQRIMHHAEAYNVKTAIHTGASFGPVLAASWHLAMAMHSMRWLERVVASMKIQDAFMIDHCTVTDGHVGLPTSPGLGVKLTPELLSKYKFIPGSGERT